MALARNSCGAILSIPFLCLILMLSSCERRIPTESEISPNAEYTGGNWKSGHWKHCEVGEKGALRICREHQSDGTLTAIGYYADGIDLSKLRQEENSGGVKIPFAMGRIYFSGAPYLPLSRVETDMDGDLDAAFFMPLDCQEALGRQDYASFVNLSLRTFEVGDFQRSFQEVIADASNQFLLEQISGRVGFAIPGRGEFLNGCRVQFHW